MIEQVKELARRLDSDLEGVKTGLKQAKQSA